MLRLVDLKSKLKNSKNIEAFVNANWAEISLMNQILSFKDLGKLLNIEHTYLITLTKKAKNAYYDRINSKAAFLEFSKIKFIEKFNEAESSTFIMRLMETKNIIVSLLNHGVSYDEIHELIYTTNKSIRKENFIEQAKRIVGPLKVEEDAILKRGTNSESVNKILNLIKELEPEDMSLIYDAMHYNLLDDMSRKQNSD